MITIEGQGEGRIVWTVWRPGDGMPGIPPHFSTYVRSNVEVSPVLPCAMCLPPVALESIWWPVEGTELGGRVRKLEVGFIESSESPLRKPLPCRHSTITGTIMDLGLTSLSAPVKWRYCYDAQPNYVQRYRDDGLRCSFLAGRPATSTDGRARDENGDLVKIRVTSSNPYLWSSNSFIYAHILPAKYPSNFAPYYHIKLGEWWATKPPSGDCLVAFRNVRHTWKHVSANVWIEEWWQVYHHNASYVPMNPLGDDGYGYVIASVKRKRTHTLHSLQQRAPADFRGMFNVEEECTYKGYVPGGFNPEYVTGKMKGVYTYIAQLQVLEPGACAYVMAPAYSGPMDAYCAVAPSRAGDLYEERHMTTARSNAVADVSGLESNWLENLSQVKGTLDVIKPLIAGYDAVTSRDLNAARKALASAYLAYKYSIAPTLSDVKDVTGNIKTITQAITKYRFSNERRRGACHTTCAIQYSSKAEIDYYCTLHYRLKDNSLSTVWNALERLGLDPSLGNAWDFVPYSFVIDWFAKIGPALTRIGQYTSNVLFRDLQSRVQSYKVRWCISESEMSTFGLKDTVQILDPLVYSWYDRRVDHHLGVFDAFAGQSNNGLSVSQMTQGAALLSNYLD